MIIFLLRFVQNNTSSSTRTVSTHCLRVENVCQKLNEIAALKTKMAAIQNILKVTSRTRVCLK